MNPVDAILTALRRGELAGSRTLNLAGAGLREVPDELFGLAETLEVLDLGDNRLTSLPAAFAGLRQLKVLFVSGNALTVLPPVLGDLPVLSQLGARRVGLEELPAESLPPQIRWLTLTDNALQSVPEELGRRPRLQKLMLAGNRLSTLPESLADAQNLELLRVSANRLGALPSWLAELPALAWLAWSGNPFEAQSRHGLDAAIPWSELKLGSRLGEGASGRVYEAVWARPSGDATVAVKLFRGSMTSDGLPAHEMAACLAAGEHRNLTGALGRVTGHPEGALGLVMPRIPLDWRVLAQPPSQESCSRDVYASGLQLELEVVMTAASDVAAAAAHLHDIGLMHGDLYAHNTLWDHATGHAVLSDFGAASRLAPGHDGERWVRLETLAWGRLLRELLDRCRGVPNSLRQLQSACEARAPKERPRLREITVQLGGRGWI